jgi:hypothetical protein
VATAPGSTITATSHSRGEDAKCAHRVVWFSVIPSSSPRHAVAQRLPAVVARDMKPVRFVVSKL